MLKLLFAVLLLAIIGLSSTSVGGKSPSYNPGDLVNLTITNDNSNMAGTITYVNFTNNSLNVTCNSSSYSSSPPYTAYINCSLPVNLANGSWNITVYNAYNFTDDRNFTENFTLNSTIMRVNVTDVYFMPGNTLVYYINTTFANSSQFDIDTSAFNTSLNATYIIHCSSALERISTGYYNGTCTVNTTAAPGDYLFRGFYPNSNASDIFTVNVSYNAPNVSVNISAFRIEKNNYTYINVTIRSNSNTNDTLNVTVTGCDDKNLTCSVSSNLSNNQTGIAAFGLANVTMNITSLASASNMSFNVTVTVYRWNNTAISNSTNVTVTINPFHNFSWDAPTGTGSIAAGSTIQYTFSINNTGETDTSYNFTCVSNISYHTCYFNTTNASVTLAPNVKMDVNVSVALSINSPLNWDSKVNVTVTDSYDLSKLLSTGNYFTTTTLGNLGDVTVTNVSQYMHVADELYIANISINNTGNVDTETLYNITVTAQNSSGWVLNVSNTTTYSACCSYLVNSTNSFNFTMNINALESKNLTVRITVPSGATSANFTKLFIYAVSSTNGSRQSENATVLIKIPTFNFSVNMIYDRTNEQLNWTIANITREPGININSSYFSFLNYTMTQQSNGSLQRQNATANISHLYVNDTINSGSAIIGKNGSWPSGAYYLNISGGTLDNYNFTFRGTFYIARWVGLNGSVLSYTMATGITFNVTVSNVFEATGISVNASSASSPITYIYFGSGGGSCISTPYVNTSYIFSCITSTLTNTSYYLNITSSVSSCSRDFSCTFTTALNNKTAINITETYSPGTTGDGQQNAPPASNATNRTTTTTTGLKFTMPSNVTLLNTSQTIYIPLNNTNTSRQNITVNISEASDYIHFSLTYVAPKNISGNSTSTVNITLTPFKWAKPGTYTITVTINSANSTFTVTVPQPNDTKKIHRYVEVSKDRTKSMVTLGVKNRNSYSVFMNVTENISKQIAASASNLTITSAINYTIIEQDPVILWTMNMSPNQERSIIYLVGGDLGNSNLFIEPNISEGRMSAGGGGGGGGVGGDMTWLIIGIIVVVVIAAAVVVYLFFLKPRGIKLPIKYGAFVKQEKKGEGVLGVLKGITAKIMSVFKRGEKKEPIAGEKKSIFSRLSFKKKAEVKEEPKKEEKKIAPGKPKPTKEDLLKKLNEVYKK